MKINDKLVTGCLAVILTYIEFQDKEFSFFNIKIKTGINLF